MRRILIGLIPVFLVNVADAQEDLLACVDPDVRAGLLFDGAGAQTRVSRTVPEVLASLPKSDDVEFIASSVSGAQTMAAYRAAITPGDAMDAVSGVLEQGGWREMDTGTPPRGGFVASVEPQSLMMCRDSSMMFVMGIPTGDATYVNMRVMENPTPAFCDMASGAANTSAAVPTFSRGFGGAPGPQVSARDMPTLEIPDGATTLQPGQGRIIREFSSSTRAMASAIDLETELSTQELLDHFGRQLEEQGWSYDTGWSGDVSSGSTWTRTAAADPDLAGLLDVIALGDSRYSATFRASSREPE